MGCGVSTVGEGYQYAHLGPAKKPGYSGELVSINCAGQKTTLSG